MADEATSLGTSLEPTLLEGLPSELFARIALKLDLASLGRLAGVSTALRGALDNGHEAWDAQWASETAGSLLPSRLSARAAMRSLASLEDVHWERMSSQPAVEGPAWRQDACLLHHDGMVILFAGRSFDAYEDVQYFDDAWVFATAQASWHRVAAHSRITPRPRCFNSDGGGGGCVIRGHGQAWAMFFGGKRAEGFRDSETWLLGPLAAPRQQWSWVPVKPDPDVSVESPQARFHHTMTVVPHEADADAAAADIVFMIGGHSRTIAPLNDVYAFSLRNASFEWPREGSRPVQDSHDGARVAAVASWVLTKPPGPRPTPRGFHCANYWRPRAGHAGFIVVSCGLGISVDEDDADREADDDFDPLHQVGRWGYRALGDTWLYSLEDGAWTLHPVRHPEPRSRAAASVVRGMLVVCGGCRESDRWERPLQPGAPFNDVWLLGLDSFTEAWERCTLPSERIPPPVPRTQSVARAVLGGSALLILGGYDPRRSSVLTDPFGDTHTTQAWAPHEALALSFVGRDWRHEHGLRAATLCTAGLPLTDGSAGPELSPAASQTSNGTLRSSARVLLAGLSKSQELNGVVGVLVGAVPFEGGAEDREERLGVKLGAPHHRSVKVRRRNLCPSEAPAPTLFAEPDAWADVGSAVYALLPDQQRMRAEVVRLSLLPAASTQGN